MVYLEYLRTVGVRASVAIVAANVLYSGFFASASLSLRAWSADAVYPERANDMNLKYFHISVYGLMGLGQAVTLFIGSLLLFYAALKASKILHDRMLDCVFRAPISFFDKTPSGRILNRFTKDIDNTDSRIRTIILQFVMTIFTNITALLMISVATAWFLPPFFLLGVVYSIVQKYYVRTSRQLRRLESNSRSPVYSHFAETVSGTTSIRAFQAEDFFNSECDRKMDSNNGTNLLMITATRWLSVRSECLGSLILLMAASFAVYSKGDIDASTVGLSLSFALAATESINRLIKSSAELENNFVSVERCLEYTRLESEAAFEIESTKPETFWPEKGQVQFKGYAARYRDGLDLVLKNLNFSVKPGEKVGIVGRTGAGKSSLTVAMFRTVEPAAGTILIDGVDVTRIGLHDLRSKLTIIPQDPVLFTGSLRFNLDPIQGHDDSELWKVVKSAHLQKYIDLNGKGLEFRVSEGGENLSVGQRQLVCLARALLRKSKILILDEATAAVDLETDDLIQRTIQEEFTNCTTLTIAHRLNTILDYDRVLVMDKGTVAEYDSPKKLLDDSSSIFHSMAKDAGLIKFGSKAAGPPDT
ncbi:Multidrug resistance-associated protein 1 [Halotydeus destructor]|nr:Multidrug resistance-associated protein 1 [Halotydeus destructor]